MSVSDILFAACNEIEEYRKDAEHNNDFDWEDIYGELIFLMHAFQVWDDSYVPNSPLTQTERRDALRDALLRLDLTEIRKAVKTILEAGEV